MARKKYSCDFETTTKPEDCRVWAYGWMEIGNKKNYKIGSSINDFMMWCEKSQGDCYFHNLRFDGSFIVNWLLKNGYTWEKSGQPKTFVTIISNMGQWYAIDICCFCFHSLNSLLDEKLVISGISTSLLKFTP